MLLERSVAFSVRDSGSESGDGLTLNGMAAVFNQETEINSWEGRFLETIAPGAFRKTIRERTPVMQFDHGKHPLIGSIPIGSITSLRETDEGLAVEGRLSDNWLIEPVRDAIRDKNVTGMSFRFEVIRDEWRDNAGKLVKAEELMQLLWDSGERGPITRTLKEVKVAELGPVVFPAYAGTSVDVRAKGMAEMVMGQQQFVYEMRSALAQSTQSRIEDFETLKSNPDLQKELAKALLFRDAPTTIGYPSPETDPELDNSSETEERTEVEPSIETHSTAPVVDAPLPGKHPSLFKETQERLRAQMSYALGEFDSVLESATRKDL